MSKPIPEVRNDMKLLADEMRQDGFDDWANQLDDLAEATRRRSSTRTSRKSAPMTPKLAAQIRAYVHANPDRSHQQVANRFKVNPGRVSEALHGDV